MQGAPSSAYLDIPRFSQRRRQAKRQTNWDNSFFPRPLAQLYLLNRSVVAVERKRPRKFFLRFFLIRNGSAAFGKQYPIDFNELRTHKVERQCGQEEKTASIGEGIAFDFQLRSITSGTTTALFHKYRPYTCMTIPRPFLNIKYYCFCKAVRYSYDPVAFFI